MMFNSPRPLERASRVWRLDEAQAGNDPDGPIALLRSASALLIRHKIKLFLCTATGIALAAFYAHSLPPTFNATATLLLESRQALSGQDTGAQQSLDLNRADSELQIIRSERLLSAVFESLDLQRSPELGPHPASKIDVLMAYLRSLWDMVPDVEETEIGNTAGAAMDTVDRSPAGLENNLRAVAFQNFTTHMDARRVGQSYVIEIAYSSSNPALPARVANATVSGYIMQSVASKAQAARAGNETLQGRLDALDAQVDAATEAMKHGTLPAIATPDADARIIGAALPPLSRSGPRTSLITALGGVLGLLGGFVAIALNLAFDRKVRGPKELTRDTGIVCLGCVPRSGRRIGLRRMHNDDQIRYASAIRDLRTSIEVACSSLRNERSIIVAIVGWNAGTGVSTISLSLAQLIYRSGRHITLFQAATEPDTAGVADLHVLQSSASLADAAVAGLQPDQLVFGDIEGVAVLPIHSRDADVNLFADFRHPRVQRILDSVRFHSDILLDLPALNGSADALALASQADAVVIVTTLGKTTIDEVNDSLHQLRRAGANVIGAVINKTKR
jgi:Mrp family chromosome partitioning ATPase